MESKSTLKTVFLDSCVIISAVFSHKGASYKIIDLCFQQKIKPLVCRQVLVEIERNIKNKVPLALPNYFQIIKSLTTLEVLPDSKLSEIKKAEKIINIKDAPILAVAMRFKPDFFITLNTKHFDSVEVQKKSGVNIVTPGKFVKMNDW